MPAVDPSSLANFIESRSAQPEPGRFARVAPIPTPVTTPSERWAQQRLRQSGSVIGALFRGLESEIGPDEALEVVATLVMREGARHGTA